MPFFTANPAKFGVAAVKNEKIDRRSCLSLDVFCGIINLQKSCFASLGGCCRLCVFRTCNIEPRRQNALASKHFGLWYNKFAEISMIEQSK